MKVDQLSGILAFLKVAETRSFTRAAAALGVTPPSVSESIKALEARLGVRLLNRTTRSVGLTEAGAAYLQRVRPAAEEIRAAGRDLREAGGRPAGTLRLSMPWIAWPLVLDSLVTPFLDACPEVRLDVVFDDRFVDLAAEGFDAGMRIGELLDADMVAVRLGPPLRASVMASPRYLERFGRPEKPSDLARHRCIGLRFQTSRALAQWEFVQAGRTVDFTPDPFLAVNTLPLAVEAAERGVGLVFAFEALAEKALHSGALVRVLEDCSPTYGALHLYYPGHLLVPAKLQAFVRFARKAAKHR